MVKHCRKECLTLVKVSGWQMSPTLYAWLVLVVVLVKEQEERQGGMVGGLLRETLQGGFKMQEPRSMKPVFSHSPRGQEESYHQEPGGGTTVIASQHQPS